MALYIPSELTDVIIGFIEDQGTLYNCCLVCTQRLPASRQQLFRAITIDSAERYTLFIARVLHVESQRPYLRLVQSLELSDTSSISIISVLARSYPQMSRTIFLTLAGQLPALAELTIHARIWRGDHPFSTGEPLLFSQFSSLHKLTLLASSLPSFTYMRRVITALPRLRDFDWRLASCSRSCLGHTVFQPTPRPVLHRLSLAFTSDGDIDDLVTWLLYTPSCSSIRHLSFHPIPPGDEGFPGCDFTSSQHTFFSAVGPHVTTLELQSHGALLCCVFFNMWVLILVHGDSRLLFGALHCAP